MISKMKPAEEGGSRIAIVFNGSPLFTGDAGSGESEIRRWIIENDWLEAIVALPDQLFYNTGISTYFWVVTNRKRPERRGKVQLIDAAELFVKMRKTLGDKRNEICRPSRSPRSPDLYGEFTEGEHVQGLHNEDFGYQRITVERPLRLRWEVTAGRSNALRDEAVVQKIAEAEAGASWRPVWRSIAGARRPSRHRWRQSSDALPQAHREAALGRAGVRTPRHP